MTDFFQTIDPIPRGPVDIRIGECLGVLKTLRENGVRFDAIITDPPYEIGLHGKAWDRTGIAFSPNLWGLFHDLLKPGAFVAAFGAARLYHRLAIAAEDANLTIYPFLQWQFPGGLPKPVNVSELFDRDNLDERPIIGWRKGSGYTKANVDQGAQGRTRTDFPIYARGVSEESAAWTGYYYGVNCFRPTQEPILLAQKACEHDRVIDNIRAHSTGALNLGALEKRTGNWPSTTLQHTKAKKREHGSTHPSVKPVSLMEELCLLACPTGGAILDPFAGTGTTGVAASRLGFSCTLIEQNPEMEGVIRRRLG